MKAASKFLVIVLSSSMVIVNSQTGEHAKEQYAAWKSSVLSSLDSSDHLYYYRVATLIKRVDENHIQVKIAVAGRVRSYGFSFQPIGVLVSYDPDADQQLAGSEYACSVAKAIKHSTNGQMVDFEEVLEVTKQAIAIKISVKPYAENDQPPEIATIKSIVELTDHWSFSETTTFVPPPIEAPR